MAASRVHMLSMKQHCCCCCWTCGHVFVSGWKQDSNDSDCWFAFSFTLLISYFLIELVNSSFYPEIMLILTSFCLELFCFLQLKKRYVELILKLSHWAHVFCWFWLPMWTNPIWVPTLPLTKILIWHAFEMEARLNFFFFFNTSAVYRMHCDELVCICSYVTFNKCKWWWWNKVNFVSSPDDRTASFLRLRASSFHHQHFTMKNHFHFLTWKSRI